MQPNRRGGQAGRVRGAELRWPVWLMWLALAGYVVGLALPRSGFNPVVDIGLALSTSWLAAGVCWAGVFRTRFARGHVLWAALGVSLMALGDTYYVLVAASAGQTPSPSPADVAYLLFYAAMLAALAALVLRQLRGLPAPVLLDSAVGLLGAAAILAVVLNPVLESAMEGPPSLATAVGVAYPAFDLLLIAAIAGIAAAPALHLGRGSILLVGGLAVFTAADVWVALIDLSGDYVIGTGLDAGWALGITLIAAWVDLSVRTGRAVPAVRDGRWALAVPAAATVLGLGILLASSRLPVSELAVVLAGATLVLAAVRTQLAFRQLKRMADLRGLARTDDLTGLPNRRALYSDVPLRLGARQGGSSALLLLDLDRFKEVNDSLGHDVGDLLLIQVGTRLDRQLRTGDLLARLGGDEFALLLDDVGPEQAAAVAVKLRAALARPFTLEGITLQANVSIGIALFPEQGHDLKTLLRKADMAMYKAKSTRTGHHVYVNADDIRGDERLRTLQELRAALAEGQLVLHYQPKIELATGHVRGVEALVRWNHPDRGLLNPDAFLDIVEESGLMHELTDVVLSLALDQAAIWQAQGRTLTVAVNLSASSLVDADLPERIGAMVTARGLPPAALMVEITEEFLMDDRDRARDILTRLRESGIRVSVDDFGTGYSSLAYLRDLPIDELKLDRSFIAPMADDPRAAALVCSIIDLAHSLGLRMVAEGVEDAVAYDQLTGYGCEQAQGFHICRPVPADELDRWLAERRVTTATGRIR